MYQKIACAKCGRTIAQFYGMARATEGWAECRCGFETKISKAICTNEYRLVPSRQPPTCSCTSNTQSQPPISEAPRELEPTAKQA
jgi:hypothetical protein